MSTVSMSVPTGYEALHLVSATAMAAGYAVGRQTASGKFPSETSRLPTLACAAISVCSVVLYYLALSYNDPGVFGTIELAVLAFFTFAPFTYILAITRTWQTG